MSLPVVAIVALLMVFGVPYLIIYLQGRRLAAIEARLATVIEKLDRLERNRVASNTEGGR